MRAVPLLLLAACAGTRGGTTASVALADPDVRLETWSAAAVENAPLHPDPAVQAVLRMTGTAARVAGETADGEAVRKAARDFGRVLGSMAGRGRTFGGAGFLTLALVRFGEEGERVEEALVLEMPAGGPADRTLSEREFTAWYEAPPGEPRGALERGTVRIRRHGNGRAEFHIALLLRDGDGGNVHVVAKVEAEIR